MNDMASLAAYGRYLNAFWVCLALCIGSGGGAILFGLLTLASKRP